MTENLNKVWMGWKFSLQIRELAKMDVEEGGLTA